MMFMDTRELQFKWLKMMHDTIPVSVNSTWMLLSHTLPDLIAILICLMLTFKSVNFLVIISAYFSKWCFRLYGGCSWAKWISAFSSFQCSKCRYHWQLLLLSHWWIVTTAILWKIKFLLIYSNLLLLFYS